MAAKTTLGIDIGHNQLKLALVKGTTVKRSAVVEMPEGMVKDYQIVSVEAMGELLRKTVREHHMRCKNAAIVLSGEIVFLRQLSMPVMTADQLVFNLPFEFRDYITDDYRNYYFDYAMISTTEDILNTIAVRNRSDEESEESPQMELMAAAVNKEIIEDLRQIVRKAGMKLKKAAPVLVAYQALVESFALRFGGTYKEYCIVDLGYKTIRMYMFNGVKYSATRELDSGLLQAENEIADEYAVDIHLAHTYLETNFDNCQNKEGCMQIWNGISVELMRSLNFYRFSNPDSVLQDIWLCGGGAAIPALREVLKNSLQINVHSAEELIKEGKKPIEDVSTMLQAIGITQS